MPLYNYRCPSCGNEFEKVVSKYDTEAKESCPKCEEQSDFFMPLGSRDNVKFLFNYMAPDE